MLLWRTKRSLFARRNSSEPRSMEYQSHVLIFMAEKIDRRQLSNSNDEIPFRFVS